MIRLPLRQLLREIGGALGDAVRQLRVPLRPLRQLGGGAAQHVLGRLAGADRLGDALADGYRRGGDDLIDVEEVRRLPAIEDRRYFAILDDDLRLDQRPGEAILLLGDRIETLIERHDGGLWRHGHARRRCRCGHGCGSAADGRRRRAKASAAGRAPGRRPRAGCAAADRPAPPQPAAARGQRSASTGPASGWSAAFAARR